MSVTIGRITLAALMATTLGAAPGVAQEVLKLAHWVPPAHTLTASTIEPLKAGV